MEEIIIVLLIIFIFTESKEIKKLKNENKTLKHDLQFIKEKLIEQKSGMAVSKENGLVEDINYKTNDEKLNSNSENYNVTPNNIRRENNDIFEKYKKVTKKKEKFSSNEKRNVLLLISGAFCIILSAIVFLMSTWEVIPNVLKLFVLILLTFVFFGASNIASNKFKLKKVGETFFYLAMAYIPICLAAIWIFHMLGSYLSIDGEGSSIYLTGAAILTAIIYYAVHKKNNSIYLMYGSIMSQLLSIISFTLIFSDEPAYILQSVLVYCIAIGIFTKKDLYKKLCIILQAATSIYMIYILIFYSYDIVLLFGLFVLNNLIVKIRNNNLYTTYAFDISLIAMGAYVSNYYFEDYGKNIVIMVATLFIIAQYFIQWFVHTLINKKELGNVSEIVTLISIGIIHLMAFNTKWELQPYIFSLIQFLLLAISYPKFDENGKKVCSVLAPLYFIATGTNLLIDFKCENNYLFIFAIAMFVLGEVLKSNNESAKSFWNAISQIFVAITYVIFFANNESALNEKFIYASLFFAMYVYNYFRYGKSMYKYFIYIVCNLVVYTGMNLVVQDNAILAYTPMITTIIILIAERLYGRLKDDWSEIYLSISEIVTFLVIYAANYRESISGFENILIIPFAFGLFMIIRNKMQDKDMFNIIPSLGIIPALFWKANCTGIEVWILVAAFLFLTILSILEKEISIYTIFSGVYLGLIAMRVETVYLWKIVLMCWSIINFIFMSESKKSKSILEFMIYLSGLIIYNTAISEADLLENMVATMFGYIVFVILVTRKILAKYIKNVDAVEYILLGIMYLRALLNYADQLDGIYFSALLIGIIIFSFMKKYGSVFIITLIALMINVIALTREFWEMLPWWAYLLGVGVILMIFAIINEAREQKVSINVLKLISDLKNKIEK